METPAINTTNSGHTDASNILGDSPSSSDSPSTSTSSPEDEDDTRQAPPSSPPLNHDISLPTLPDDVPTLSGEIAQPSSPQQAFQIHPKFLINPYAVEPSYFTRPNRWFGPDSTWRSWTEADRVVYSSLERAKAEDLGAHLYNAFALKRQKLRDKEARTIGKGKERDVSIEEEDPSFEPPERWTAWPLPSDKVPRMDFVRGLDGLSHRKKDQKSVRELEECLIAATQRYSRESWKKREDQMEEQDVKQDEASNGQPNVKPKTQKKVEVNANVAMEDGTAKRTTAPNSNSSETSESSSYPTSSAGVQYFSSQAFAASETSTSSEETESEASEEFTRLVPMIDDDYARELLLPSARHLMSKLDDLLLALHTSQARRAYGRGPQKNPRSRSRLSVNAETKPGHGDDVTKTAESQHSDHSRHRYAKSPHPSSSPRKPRSRSRRSRDLTSDSRSQSHLRSKSAALPLRNWKFIIQQANNLNGFSPATIKRASKRCAKLFEEDILIRTYHEADLHERGRPKPYIEEYFALDTTDESEEDDVNNVSSERVRTSAACTRCYMHKLKCEPPSTEPNTGQEGETTSCAACTEVREQCSGIECGYRVRDVQHGAFCPHPQCKRHTNGFKKPSDLKRHLTLTHGGETPSFTSGRPTLKRRESNLSARSVDLDIYCPVEGCSRAEGTDRPFKTGSKMYRHIRGAHPTLDVEEVKKMELIRRGDRRGTWSDKRRHRSRSKAKSSDSRGELSTDDVDD